MKVVILKLVNEYLKIFFFYQKCIYENSFSLSFRDSTLFAIFLGHRPWLPSLLTLSSLSDLSHSMFYIPCHMCTVIFHPDLPPVHGTHIWQTVLLKMKRVLELRRCLFYSIYFSPGCL